MKTPRYLVEDLYTADPSVHVFEGRVYIYPSHDIDTGSPENDNGDHFDMRDYHVYSMDRMDGAVIDHGVCLDIRDIPWAGRQLWAPDAASRNGRYYFYFPAKDHNDIFHIGVAVGSSPTGPFRPMPYPIQGSYSIDPAVFKDDDGSHYMCFGGLWGGQLQRYRNNKAIERGHEPASEEAALCPKIVRLHEDMLEFAEPPRDLMLLDETGQPIKAGDHQRRFFEGSWLHKYQDVYYYSYSTGNTHKICYATASNPYGPYTYRGVILTPVVGWTTQHSILAFSNRWYLFYHDSVRSGGKTWLRSIKVVEMKYDTDGGIQTLDGLAS